jgi:hypothetical protein
VSVKSESSTSIGIVVRLNFTRISGKPVGRASGITGKRPALPASVDLGCESRTLVFAGKIVRIHRLTQAKSSFEEPHAKGLITLQSFPDVTSILDFAGNVSKIRSTAELMIWFKRFGS